MKLSDKEIHTANFPLDSRRISRNCALGATTRLTIENFTRHDRFGNVNSQSVSTLVQVDSWNLSFRDLDPSGFPFSPPSCWILFENRATIILTSVEIPRSLVVYLGWKSERRIISTEYVCISILFCQTLILFFKHVAIFLLNSIEIQIKRDTEKTKMQKYLENRSEYLGKFYF